MKERKKKNKSVFVLCWAVRQKHRYKDIFIKLKMKKFSRQNLGKYSITFFLLAFPLFFLPGRLIPLGLDVYAKLFFLIFAVSIIFFLIFDPRKKDLGLGRKLFFALPVLMFLFFYLASSALSGDFSGGFWGGSKPLLPGVGLTFFFFLYLILSQTSFSSRQIVKLISITHAALVALLFLEYLSHWLGLLISHPGVFDFFRKMLGSYEDVSVYLALQSVLLAGFLFLKKDRFQELWQKIFLATWLIGIFLLININYLPAWLVLFFGSFALFMIEKKLFSKQKKTRVISWLPVLSLLFIILSFFVTGHASTLKQREASNFRLNYQDSLSVAKETFLSNLIFGQGAENLGEFFSLHRPADLNEGPWWNIRFKQSSSFLFDLFFASGLIGVLAFSYLLFSLAFIVFSSLGKFKRENEIIFSFAALVPSFFATFVFFASSPLVWFLFFVCLAVLERQFFDQKKPQSKFLLPVLHLKEGQIKTCIYSVVKILALVFVIFIFVFNLKIFVAESFFRCSLVDKDIDSKIGKMTTASQLNPGEEQYKLALAKALKNKALQVLSDSGSSRQDFEIIINQSLSTVRKALEENGSSLAARETQGLIYRDISQNSTDSLELAIQGFEQASLLEPTNPVLLTEIGKLYFVKQAFDKAESKFLQAISLKDDYFEAKFELAKTLATLSRFEEGLKILDDIKGDYNEVDLHYEWGKIEFNRGRLDKALEQFFVVLEKEAKHSNALYAIALIHEKKGQTQTALEFFERVEQLNPDNIDVRNKIERLDSRL